MIEFIHVRSKIAALAADGTCTPWLQRVEDVDILRYLLWHKDENLAWEKLQATAKWREEEGIDGVLAENLDDVFEPGKEEMLYLPPDKLGRPVLLYRSALHKPGQIDPQRFTRYVIQQTERARLQYGLGTEVQSIVIVDRIGSGLKNQDPALLKVLLPVIVDHYPEVVGYVYVAPISLVFNVIWKIIQVSRPSCSTHKNPLLFDYFYSCKLLPTWFMYMHVYIYNKLASSESAQNFNMDCNTVDEERVAVWGKDPVR